MNNRITRRVARGICFNDKNILCLKSNGKDNFFLPGGGLEKYESASVALVREIKEELNVTAEIQSFIGVIENLWENDDVSVYETNFVFSFEILGRNKELIKTVESNLSLEWISIFDLKKINLKPNSMKKTILKTKNTFGTSAIWHTNF